MPSQCGTSAFKQWPHCLCNGACLWNAAALHPNTAALPMDCSNTAFRMWQHCLWTAPTLLLDSDTAFSLRQHCLQLVAALPSHGSGNTCTMRQHCLQLVAAMPSHGSGSAFPMRQHCLQFVAAIPSHDSGSAFTMWQHCLQTVVPLPLQCCMPLECCSTASQHCSAASGLQQLCLWTAAALLLDSDTASPKRQHCLQLVAALPSHGSGRAFTMRQQHCCWTVTLPSQ